MIARIRNLLKPSKDLEIVCARAGMDMDAVIERVKKFLPDAPVIEMRDREAGAKLRQIRNAILQHDGKSMTANEWSTATGISAGSIRRRLYDRWTVADALLGSLCGIK